MCVITFLFSLFNIFFIDRMEEETVNNVYQNSVSCLTSHYLVKEFLDVNYLSI